MSEYITVSVLTIILTAILSIIYKLYIELQSIKIKLAEIETNIRWIIKKVYKEDKSETGDQR
ncbi:MAG: hypothetical protein ACP5IE_06770 [Infirmifilum sp.]